MSKFKTYSVETADVCFMVHIYEEASGSYLAEYVGATPKFAQLVPPGGAIPVQQDVPGRKLRGADLDELFEQVCAAIVERHGAITH